MQKITPCLWFNDNAEEAVNFYCSVFKNSHIGDVMHYGQDAPMPEGTVLTIEFELDGQQFIALNGGSHFQFSPAISFHVNCHDQQEVDELWEKLLEGGEKEQCGWLRDKFGISWQIIPSALLQMMKGPDTTKSHNAVQALHQMEKIDIEKLQQAYEG